MKISRQDLIDLERCFLDEIDYATVIRNYDYHFVMSKLLSMPVQIENNVEWSDLLLIISLLQSSKYKNQHQLRRTGVKIVSFIPIFIPPLPSPGLIYPFSIFSRIERLSWSKSKSTL